MNAKLTFVFGLVFAALAFSNEIHKPKQQPATESPASRPVVAPVETSPLVETYSDPEWYSLEKKPTQDELNAFPMQGPGLYCKKSHGENLYQLRLAHLLKAGEEAKASFVKFNETASRLALGTARRKDRLLDLALVAYRYPMTLSADEAITDVLSILATSGDTALIPGFYAGWIKANPNRDLCKSPALEIAKLGLFGFHMQEKRREYQLLRTTLLKCDEKMVADLESYFDTGTGPKRSLWERVKYRRQSQSEIWTRNYPHRDLSKLALLYSGDLNGLQSAVPLTACEVWNPTGFLQAATAEDLMQVLPRFEMFDENLESELASNLKIRIDQGETKAVELLGAIARASRAFHSKSFEELVRVASSEKLGNTAETKEDADTLMELVGDMRLHQLRNLSRREVVPMGTALKALDQKETYESEDQAKILTDGFFHSKPAMREQAVRTAMLNADVAMASGDALTSYLVTLIADDDQGVRVAATQALKELGMPDAKQKARLFSYLNGDRFDVRNNAAIGLLKAYPTIDEAKVLVDAMLTGRIDTYILKNADVRNENAYIPGLIAGLESGDSAIQKNALIALRHLGEDSLPALPQLTALLESKEHRFAAVQAIGAIGKRAAQAIPPLLKLYRDTESHELQSSILNAMAGIRSEYLSQTEYLTPSARELIRKNMEILTNDVAMQVIADRNARLKNSVVSGLKPLLKSRDVKVRTLAALALNKYSSFRKDAFPVLKEAFEAGLQPREVAWALSESRAGQKVLMDSLKDKELRFSASVGLGRASFAQAYPLVKSGLWDESPEVRAASTNILTSLFVSNPMLRSYLGNDVRDRLIEMFKGGDATEETLRAFDVLNINFAGKPESKSRDHDGY